MPKSISRAVGKPTRHTPTKNRGGAVAPPAATVSAPAAWDFNRSTFARVVLIHKKLALEERFTAETLAAEIQVSSRTILRDVQLMQNQLGMPVEWDPGEHSYVYTRACDTLPLLCLSSREAVAFALAGRAFAKVYGPAFGRILSDLLQKVGPLFGGQVSLAAETVERVLSEPATAANHALDHFFPLYDAISGRQVLRLDYRKRQSNASEKRAVHPLHLAELKNGWNLIAYCRTRRAVRKFLLARMQGVTALGETFEPPPRFDPAKYVRDALGSHAGEGDHEVRIILDAYAASFARETPWHHSQQLTARPDGRFDLTLRINGLADAQIEVLRWGEHAAVVSPQKLRDSVCASLHAALELYAQH